MDLPFLFTDHLDALSEALEGTGDDLRAILSVLTDDLRTAVPSFTGLTVTTEVDGEQITVTAMNSDHAAASMLLPLEPLTGQPGGSHIIFYARRPGAFHELAAATRTAYGLDGDVVLDRHFPPPNTSSLGVPGELAQRSDIDQAIGVLIEQGLPPEEARKALEDRAATATVTVHHVARDILNHLDGPAAPGDPN